MAMVLSIEIGDMIGTEDLVANVISFNHRCFRSLYSLEISHLIEVIYVHPSRPLQVMRQTSKHHG